MLDETIKKLFHNKKARLSAKLTLISLPFAFSLPVFLNPVLWPYIEPGQLVFSQFLFVLVALNIGLTITVYFVKPRIRSFWENSERFR